MSTWMWIAICGAAFFIGFLLGDINERRALDALKYKMDMVKSTFDILEATAEDERQKEVIRLCRDKILGGRKDD